MWYYPILSALGLNLLNLLLSYIWIVCPHLWLTIGYSFPLLKSARHLQLLAVAIVWVFERVCSLFFLEGIWPRGIHLRSRVAFCKLLWRFGLFLVWWSLSLEGPNWQSNPSGPTSSERIMIFGVDCIPYCLSSRLFDKLSLVLSNQLFLFLLLLSLKWHCEKRLPAWSSWVHYEYFLAHIIELVIEIWVLLAQHAPLDRHLRIQTQLMIHLCFFPLSYAGLSLSLFELLVLQVFGPALSDEWVGRLNVTGGRQAHSDLLPRIAWLHGGNPALDIFCNLLLYVPAYIWKSLHCNMLREWAVLIDFMVTCQIEVYLSRCHCPSHLNCTFILVFYYLVWVLWDGYLFLRGTDKWHIL